MRYAIARYNQHQREVAYRIYVSDCLRMNLEAVAGLGNKQLNLPRFADIYENQSGETRTAGEIVDLIRKKL